LDKAIAHYCSKGNFRRAATHKQNLGELFELELGDEGRAAAAYEEAAGWFESVCLANPELKITPSAYTNSNVGQRRRNTPILPFFGHY